MPATHERPVRPLRSLLYMPGSNPRALEKAASLHADGLILDLEDAVAPEAKDMARTQVCASVAARGFGRRAIIIRINGLGTPWVEADLKAAIEAKPDAILVPKINSSADLAWFQTRIDKATSAGGPSLWAMMETPLAMLQALEIASTPGCLECLVMGTNDLIKELHAQQTPDRVAVMTGAGLCLLAARARGLAIVDGVYNDIQNASGFEASCHQGRAMGFDGKTLIHPGQLDICNRVFAPSAEEVAQARKILNAFDQPENRGKGAISLDGRMVELLHAKIAAQTVAMAEALPSPG